MTPLIYIHGFNSSPQSYKARVLGDYLRQHTCDVDFTAPALPGEPQAAISQLQGLVEEHLGAGPVLVGSSLGGYYATWLACRYGLRAVLINPAVRPYELLQNYLGPNRNDYTGEVFELSETSLLQLRQLETESGPAYQQLQVYLETGDEVLDYRQAEAKYQTANLHIFAGGGHAFMNFQACLADIVNELGILCEPTTGQRI